jgi:V8-like Glu-specific endopeptidase
MQTGAGHCALAVCERRNMSNHEGRTSIVSLAAACTIAIAATACSGNAEPQNTAGSLDAFPAAIESMPAQIVDPDGTVWEKVGVAKISDAKVEDRDPNLPTARTDDPNETVEHMAARIRPIMETRGIEYRMSWNDSLRLAAEMQKPLIAGQADGVGPDGTPLTAGGDDLDGRTQGIIGSESRVQVFNSGFPWNNIGFYSGPAGSCTAFKMINNNTAITAGHCFLDTNNNLMARGTIVFAAGTSGALPAVPSTCYDRRTLSDSGTNPSDDFALFRLTSNCPLNTFNTGALGWRTHPACTGGLVLNSAGYPGKNPPWGAPPPGNWPFPTMFTEQNSNGHIDCVVNQNVLWFDNDFSPGMSGGPLWEFDGTFRYTNGIMTSGHTSGSNEATRLDSRIINFFNSNAG